LNADELTRSSWAKHIKSYEEVPDVYKSFFEPFIADGYELPYTVLTPSYERFIHKTTEKLIINFNHLIYVLEKDGDTFETQCYPVDGISYVEVRTALLASSFKICGMTSQDCHTSSTLKFNTVTDYLFTPILKSARPMSRSAENNTLNLDIDHFDRLADVDFKFMNFAKRSLLGGERVLQFVLQPEIREKFLAFLQLSFFRTISPTHMLILTDRELIAIREEEVRGTQSKYGGTWDYIPLNKISSVSLREKTDDTLILTVQLPEETSFTLLFQKSRKDALDQLIEQFEEIIAQ